MKLKKVLASILAVAMVLSTMSFTVFAEDTDIIEVGTGKTYETWSAAVAAATDSNSDGSITYHIYGKVVMDKYSIGGSAETINIIGMTEDAELAVETANGTDNGVVYISDNSIKTVNFSSLELSRPNGEWRGNEGHANRFFTVWDSDGSTELVTYTECVFPNGSSNNQYGKTTYTDCTFENDSYYALWIYGSGDKGVVEVTGCTFDADRGVKIYSEDASATVQTTIENSVFEIDSKPAIISSIAGELVIENVDATACEYGLLASEPKDGRDDLASAEITVDGEAPEFVAMVGNMVCTDMDYAEAQATENKPVEIPVAKIGTTYYDTIQDAVDAAVVGDNEIVILPGTYDDSFMVNQQEGVNVTITAANKGDVTLTGTISVNGNRRQDGAETLTISNLVFDGSDKTAAHNFIIDSNGTANYPTYAHNVTVTNCDFIGNGDFDNAVVAFRESKAGSNNIVFDNVTADGLHSLIQVSNSKKITVTNSTITNGESVVNATGSAAVIFTNNTVEVENFAVRTGQGSSSTNTVADITMTGNTIKAGVTALAMRNATTTATMTGNSIVAPTTYTADNADNSTINSVAITSEEITEAVNGDNVIIPTALNISFEEVEAGLYNIVLDGEDDIYEFVGAELTFANTSATVAGEAMNYEILGISGITNAEKSIEKADTYALRLVDGAERMSGRDLVIGQVKFYGQGDINFTVAEGKVVTTEYGTNLGQYYTLDADDTTADTLTVDGIVNGEVSEVTRTVVVNVAYNHALDGTYWSDNQITVTLKDGFGNVYDAEDLTNGVATINNVKLGRLTVTLEAPGFRKYVYNTTLEAGADADDALVLNFWNNVKRNEEINGVVVEPLAEIETGKGFMAHNFLVGDIVMDYTVDEYDLAAVTSYYGTYEIAEADAEKYIKYDLNRDGNIDIIDVHYVLHTLGN